MPCHVYVSQAVAVSFYVAGFAEALLGAQFQFAMGWDPRTTGLVTLAVIAVVASVSADIALKTQYVIMAAIFLSLVSFFLGGTPADLADLPRETGAAIGIPLLEAAKKTPPAVTPLRASA